MSLPVELRMRIWREVIPESIELEGIEYLPYFGRKRNYPFPGNPKVSLLLVNGQAHDAASIISTPMLVARLDQNDLAPWNWWCTQGTKRLFRSVIICGSLHHPASDPTYNAMVPRRRTRRIESIKGNLERSFASVTMASAAYMSVLTLKPVATEGYIFEFNVSAPMPSLEAQNKQEITQWQT